MARASSAQTRSRRNSFSPPTPSAAFQRYIALRGDSCCPCHDAKVCPRVRSAQYCTCLQVTTPLHAALKKNCNAARAVSNNIIILNDNTAHCRQNGFWSFPSVFAIFTDTLFVRRGHHARIRQNHNNTFSL